MARRVRDKLRPIVEDVHEAVVRARDGSGPGGRPAPDAALAGRVARAGFASGDSPARFVAVCAAFVDAGVDDDATVDLFAACLASPSPDAALLGIQRYLDNAGGVSVFAATIVAAPPLLSLLTTVFGASQYLSDIIIRDPSTVYWLMEGSTWAAEDTVETYRGWFAREAQRFQSTPTRLDAVRRAHRQALLKIGVLDLVHHEPVEEVARRLSALADAVVGVVLDEVMEDVGGERPGDGRGLAVLALGKLGGGELNYSSDIDVIYACEDADDDAVALYTRAAQRLTDALSELTAEGYLYRVDLRLRPDGRAGPLVNTESGLRVYYENRGRPWEFQAMLKARVIAGNRELGGRLLAAISAMVFNPSLSYSPVDDIARMRVQIKENIPERERGANIKLMAGGIRDVEFVVQTLQLIHGQRRVALRTPNTLDALSLLRDAELLDGWQADSLAAAYRFFRVVEHRLQMMHQLKTHTVPQSREAIALLARRVSSGPVGEYDTDAFLDALAKHLANVRTFADSFFEGEDVHPHSVLLMLPEGDERAEAIISQYGIRDVRRAMRVLQGMAYGSFPRLLDRGARAAFENLLPLLLEDASTMGDPDLTLVNVSRIAAAGRSEASLYRLLAESEPARRVVLGIAGFSSMLTRRLCPQIGTLDVLIQSPEDLARQSGADGAFDRAAAAQGGERAAARQERERAAFDRARLAEFVLGYRDRFAGTGGWPARAALAARHLGAALDDALGEVPAALFVLGSYAVGEPRLSSDADVIVVSDGADIPAVTEGVQLVNRWFTDGGILKLDFRLRGEGASAPLVQDLSYYESYLDTRMSLWERVALSKCRAWWGPEDLHARFVEALRARVARPFTRDDVEALAGMRARVASLAPKKFVEWETKRSAGGRYDVEYLTAIGMAQTAGNDADFFTLSTRERLTRVAARGVIGKDDAAACAGALDLYDLVDYLMELQGLGHPGSAQKAADLSRYLDRAFAHLGHPAGGGVQAALARAREGVRRAYERALERA